MNLLQGAGFSCYDIYYVVRQENVASFTSMIDSDSLSLHLLKEYDGTQVYEDRRSRSLIEMKDTDNKREQISQIIESLDERLKELNNEQELNKYQQVDRKRKLLEYTIYDKKYHDVLEKLRKVEGDRNKILKTSAEVNCRLSDACENSQNLETSHIHITKELQALRKQKEMVHEELKEAIKVKKDVELFVEDLHEPFSGNAPEDIFKERNTFITAIQVSLEELKEILRSNDINVTKMNGIEERIMELEKQLSNLNQGMDCATELSSKAVRDEQLQKEIGYLEGALSSNTVQELKVKLDELDGNIMRWTADITALQSSEPLNTHGDQRDKHHNERQKLRTEECALISETNKLEAELGKWEESLHLEIPDDIRSGLTSIKSICENNKISGVHGPIIELIDCDKRFYTAVEVAAGNRLFHVVVDHDDILTEIISFLNESES